MVTGLFNAHFPIGRLRGDVDRLLGCVLDGIPHVEVAAARACTHPAITFWEDEESFHAELDIPGIKLEDVEVTKVIDYETALHNFARANHGDLLDAINKSGDYDENIAGRLMGVCADFAEKGAY